MQRNQPGESAHFPTSKNTELMLIELECLIGNIFSLFLVAPPSGKIFQFSGHGLAIHVRFLRRKMEGSQSLKQK